jgi:YVTN family beta-propeller protein
VSGLPTGTVTFLFTDIEGSTLLLKQLDERYGEVLAEHQFLLRSAFAAHAGREIDTQGDAFFVAFARAKDAVAAVVDAQRALAEHDWPDGTQVRVRMGLHSGEPVVGEHSYHGLGVHQAARIGAAANGGQVLLSSSTRELVKNELPNGVRLRDLGSRRLKDIDDPERLYQLVIEGLPSEFPRLRTVDGGPFYRRRRVLAGSAAGIVAASLAIALFASGSGKGLMVQGNAVAIVDPHSNRVVGQVPVGSRPTQVAFGSRSIWVVNSGDQTVSRIDPATRSVQTTLTIGASPTGLATTKDALWIVTSNPTSPSVTVRTFETRYGTVRRKRRIGNVVAGAPASIAAQGKSVWVAPSTGLLTRLDATTGRSERTIDPNSGPVDVAVGAGAVWATDPVADTVTRIDPTGLVTPIAVGHGPRGIAVGAGAVWVADSLDNALVRIDPRTNAVTGTTQVGAGPAGVAVGAGAVWVADSQDGTLTRIDPRTPTRTKTIHIGGSPQAIVVAAGRIWVTVQQQTVAGAEAISGGTAHFAAEVDVDAPNAGYPGDNLDPAVAGFPPSVKLLYATCAKLVNYPDHPAPAGSTLVPEVAQSLPTVSKDRRTYTFTIRRGFRFSPPSNAPVTAETFKYTIERALSPRLKGYGALVMHDIVGADAYIAGKAAHISGVFAHGKTLVIRLVAPAPDFLTRIALTNFCAVPIGTPVDPRGVPAIPMAGPYYIASYTPGQSVVLRRNPNYKSSRPHRLQRIVLTFGVSKQKTDAQIEAGRVDYAFFDVAPADAAKLADRYGPGSAAAKQGHQQYFADPLQAVDFLTLNTHRPLFRNVRLRRAVNYAIDRRALAQLGNPFAQLPEPPADAYLPPGMPGYGFGHVYPFTPDLAAARRLEGHKRRTAVFYTCNFSTCDQIGQVVKSDLAAIGIDVVVKAFPASVLYTRFQKKGEPFDLGLVDWVADYPDPADFLDRLLRSGETLPPFDDQPYAHELDAAAKLSGPARYLAYRKLATKLARNAAPWAVWGNAISGDFFSARMGCQKNQPVYGIDLAALCIRKS